MKKMILTFLVCGGFALAAQAQTGTPLNVKAKAVKKSVATTTASPEVTMVYRTQVTATADPIKSAVASHYGAENEAQIAAKMQEVKSLKNQGFKVMTNAEFEVMKSKINATSLPISQRIAKISKCAAKTVILENIL